MKITPENENVKEWISVLTKLAEGKKGPWKRALELAAVPARRRASVNLYKLSKNTKEGDAVIVPGKVLSVGKLDHSISIAAMQFSKSALEKLKASKCSVKTIGEMSNINNVRIII
ncbi:MAG: 50S ribosomal protein L18e [Candidatus Micrarchaeia archaeon]